MMMKNYMKHVYRHFCHGTCFFCSDLLVSFPIILLKLAVTVVTSLFSDIVTFYLIFLELNVSSTLEL